MSNCEHETCHSCYRIVVPVVVESRLFITKYCPHCGACISDVAKPPQEERRGTSGTGPGAGGCRCHVDMHGGPGA